MALVDFLEPAERLRIKAAAEKRLLDGAAKYKREREVAREANRSSLPTRAAAAAAGSSPPAKRARMQNRELEPGEILSQDSKCSSTSATPGAPLANEDSNTVLSSWKPHKEKHSPSGTRPRSRRSNSSDNDSVGFGNPVTSRQAAERPSAGPGAIKQAGAQPASREDAPPAIRAKGGKKTSPTNADQTNFAFKGQGAKAAIKANGKGSKISTAKPSVPSSTSEQPEKQPEQSTMADNRRPSIQNLPRIPMKPSTTTAITPQHVDDRLQTVREERPPKWYVNTPKLTTRDPKDSVADRELQRLVTTINNAAEALKSRLDITKRSEALATVREGLHNVIFMHARGPLLKRHRMLDNVHGLPKIFDSNFNGGLAWPFDIKADAEELYNKWCREIFETDIMRGIEFGKGGESTKNNNGSVKPECRINARRHGNGDLLNGQWWPFQICAYRDGAHGVTQGGVYGSEDDGVYSCILSSGKGEYGTYPNEDYGNKVLYCGTDNKAAQPSTITKSLLASVGKKPVRLIRSHNLGSKYAPRVGFRYDGLYKITDWEVLDPALQRHRFTLIRVPGQDPIRGGSGPERRPTAQEEAQYDLKKKWAGQLKD